MTRNERGFTLLELLIVLSLTALMAGMFLDPIARVFGLKSRLNQFIAKAPEALLPQDWFLKSIKGIYVTTKKMWGDEQHIEGETIASMEEDLGVPMPFSWDIAYDRDANLSTLSYTNAKQESWVVMEWSGESGGFSYYDPQKKQWQKEWQKSPFVKESDFKLPLYIRFEAEKEGQSIVMQASLESSRTYVKDVRDDIDRKIEEMRREMEAEKIQKLEQQERDEEGGFASFDEKRVSQNQKMSKKKAAKRDSEFGLNDPIDPGMDMPDMDFEMEQNERRERIQQQMQRDLMIEDGMGDIEGDDF